MVDLKETKIARLWKAAAADSAAAKGERKLNFIRRPLAAASAAVLCASGIAAFAVSDAGMKSSDLMAAVLRSSSVQTEAAEDAPELSLNDAKALEAESPYEPYSEPDAELKPRAKKLGAGVQPKDPEIPLGVDVKPGEELPMIIDIELNSMAEEVEEAMAAQAAYEAQLERGEEILSYAKTFLGTPYLMGGNSPAAFDCSGYVMYVLHALGYTQPGRSAQDVYNVSERISKEDLMPGDLVFFKRSGNSYISHVGFYAGDGKMLHMGTGGCCYTDLTIDYWTAWTYGYGRMAWTADDEETGSEDQGSAD